MTALRASFLLVAASALFAVACTPARMAVPTQLEAGRLPVERSGGWFSEGPMRIGEFAVVGIDRSWTHSDEVRINNVGHKSARQTYRYDFVAAGQKVPVACATRYHESSASFGDLTLEKGAFQLDCAVGQGGYLSLVEIDHQRHVGRVALPDVQVEVRSTRDLKGTGIDNFDPVGYQFFVSGHMVGAVQTINGGAVWIEAGTPPSVRQGIAMASAALLLLQHIDS